jgi:hypothetical protein
MATQDVWYYNELPDGYYRAWIERPENGRVIFRAIPNQGSMCTERVHDNEVELRAEIARWLRGERPAGFYAASY